MEGFSLISLGLLSSTSGFPVEEEYKLISLTTYPEIIQVFISLPPLLFGQPNSILWLVSSEYFPDS